MYTFIRNTIEIVAGNQTFVFDRRKKHRLLDYTFKRALRFAKLEDMRFYLVKAKVECGYMTAIRLNESYYYKELSRKEISYQQLMR